MRKVYTGVVVGLKNAKTASVEITRAIIHKKYLKPIKRKTKIQAHNERDDLELGDKVEIINSKPYSATKRFLVLKKL